MILCVSIGSKRPVTMQNLLPRAKCEFRFSNWNDLITEGQGGPDWVVVIDDAAAGRPAPGK